MDFSITEEQSMLADSIARYIDNDYSFEKRMQIAESDSAFSSDVWASCAELGWTAMLFPEADGGFDGGAVEMMLMMEQFGRGLVVEPFLANVVLAGGVLKRAANDAQKAEWLSGIIDGSRHAALAFAEPQARYDIANIATTARREGDHWIIDGRKTLVLNGGTADLLIVPARTSGEQNDSNGISLFVIDATATGVERKAFKTVDAHGAAEIELNKVTVADGALLGDENNGFDTLAATISDATLAVCAEAVGIMRTMHDKTVEYAKQRVQFGVPIGSFQALQHRMVDTLMACEQARSLLLRAVMLRDADSPDAETAIRELKYVIGTSGRKVAQEAVQIHGGMGVTWELDIAHYFKRMTAIEILFGDSDYQLDLIAGLS
jgi:alkylation response protein AidB-like acyl-CoA dehydrogenase